MSKVPELKSLGKTTDYVYDNPVPSILERVPNPFWDQSFNTNGVQGTIHVEAPEFTCLCPITGQPDFATIVIDYTPREHIVESKSLKLYLGAYRQFREFHEASICRIANDLVNLLDPLELRVEGRFTPRGGIPLWPKAVYSRPATK